MRRLFLTVLGMSWLALLGGCVSGRPGCDQGCNGGCNSGCNSGCGGGRGTGVCTTSHGVCDCDVSIEDYCTSRSPWIRTAYPVVLGAPVEPVPPPPAKVLPKPGLD
jgi:hypothetical protein